MPVPAISWMTLGGGDLADHVVAAVGDEDVTPCARHGGRLIQRGGGGLAAVPVLAVARQDPANAVVACRRAATTLAPVSETSTVPSAAETPCGLSSESPGGGVKVTAAMVSGVAADAVTTLDMAVDTTVPHTAEATTATGTRLMGMGGHLSLVVGF